MTTLDSTAREWDQVRTAFATSIMVDTPLSSLAQNLDGPSWPIAGADETAAAYIDLNYEEAVELLALKGQKPERLSQLIVILRDTLAFDAPFGDMVAQSEVAAAQDNPVLKNLAKLEIPPDYPIDLTALSLDTLEFCRLEKLTTLSEFAVFAQGMAQSVIVGGDFRTLLNALSHVDEAVIARFLPFRPGSKGLHLVEAVGQVARALSPTECDALVAGRQKAPDAAVARVQRLVQHFSTQAAALRGQVDAGVSLSRLVVPLNDPALEAAVAALLQPHVAPAAVAPRKSGFLGRLFGR